MKGCQVRKNYFNPDKGGAQDPSGLEDRTFDKPCDFYSERTFRDMLVLERKRTERSKKPFLLVLIEAASLLRTIKKKTSARGLCAAIGEATREIDIKGWYERNKVLGIIYLETDISRKDAIAQKLTTCLRRHFPDDPDNSPALSFRIFPGQHSPDSLQPGEEDAVFYPEIKPKTVPARMSIFAKRVIDIAGSLAGIIALSPLFLAVAVLIKCTSKGPVFFVQTRLGKHGKPFAMFKFRSMYIGSDEAVHKEYSEKFIRESSEWARNGKVTMYKLQNDQRVTRLGRILRRTSIDELPQLFNVLSGSMSLVGPRPAIPYELPAYDVWQRRRILETTPGLTGPWQVGGRSTTTFETMVRMDIRYILHRTLMLDFKLLIKTVVIVFLTRGAL